MRHREKEARETFREAVRTALVLDRSDEVADAIMQYVDEMFDVKFDEFDDRINKRGIYNPDY
jgi:hypothetical protein